jgi:hypothetical protein
VKKEKKRIKLQFQKVYHHEKCSKNRVERNSLWHIFRREFNMAVSSVVVILKIPDVDYAR